MQALDKPVDGGWKYFSAFSLFTNRCPICLSKDIKVYGIPYNKISMNILECIDCRYKCESHIKRRMPKIGSIKEDTHICIRFETKSTRFRFMKYSMYQEICKDCGKEKQPN